MKTNKPPLRSEGRDSLVVSVKHTDKVQAVRTGIFFILATVLAMKGLKLSNTILLNQDFLMLGTAHSFLVVLGDVVEWILICTACGTALFIPICGYLKSV